MFKSARVDVKYTHKGKQLLKNLEFARKNAVRTGFLNNTAKHPKSGISAPQIAYFMAQRHKQWNILEFSFGTPFMPKFHTMQMLNYAALRAFNKLEPINNVFKGIQADSKYILQKGFMAINSPMHSLAWGKKKGFMKVWAFTGWSYRQISTQTQEVKRIPYIPRQIGGR